MSLKAYLLGVFAFFNFTIIFGLIIALFSILYLILDILFVYSKPIALPSHKSLASN